MGPFYLAGGGNFDQFREAQTYTGTLSIPRVVGHGLFLNNAYYPDGRIQDLALGTFIGSGVVGRRAFVKVAAISEDIGNTHEFKFVLNGETIGVITLPPASPGMLSTDERCFEVDTRHLKFALRNPGAEPTAGLNEFTITGDGRRPPIISEITILTAMVVSITIEAMAPVLLVHGILSGPEAFDQFEPVLNQVGIPTRRATLGDGSIADGGLRLAQDVAVTAAEFGASRVHLVAHSKGGLWSRQMIRSLSADVGVYSLTTLDTPHNGSAFADSGAPVVLGLTVFSAAARSISDLSVSGLRRFNRSTPLVPYFRGSTASNRIRYSFFAADANRVRDVEVEIKLHGAPPSSSRSGR